MNISESYARTSKYHDMFNRLFAMVSIQVTEFWKVDAHNQLLNVPNADYNKMKATAYYEIIRRTRCKRKVEEFISNKNVRSYMCGVL